MAGVCSILAASILILFNTVSVLHLAMQWKKEEILMPLRISCIAKLVLAPITGKGGSVEERLYKKLHSIVNLKFLFISLFVHLLKNCSQCFSSWNSAETLYCSKKLS